MRRAPSAISCCRPGLARSSTPSAATSTARACSARSPCHPSASHPREEKEGPMGLVWDGITEAFRLIFTGDAQVYEIAFLSLGVSAAATAIALVIGLSVASLLALREALSLAGTT